MKLIAPSPWLVIQTISAVVFVITLIVVLVRLPHNGKTTVPRPLGGVLVLSLLTVMVPWLALLDVIILLVMAAVRSQFEMRRRSPGA